MSHEPFLFGVFLTYYTLPTTSGEIQGMNDDFIRICNDFYETKQVARKNKILSCHIAITDKQR